MSDNLPVGSRSNDSSRRVVKDAFSASLDWKVSPIHGTAQLTGAGWSMHNSGDKRLDEILEPTPFREGSFLKVASGRSSVDNGLKEMIFEPSNGGEPYRPVEKHEKEPRISCTKKRSRNMQGLLLDTFDADISHSIGALSAGTAHNVKLPAVSSASPGNAPVAQIKTACSHVDASINQSKKRPHMESPNDDVKVLPHHEDQWIQNYNEMLKFREQFGHCHVHYTYERNHALSKWVQRQRYQYKLKLANKRSTMTDSRQQKLEAVGFVWDSHAATWQQRLNELATYNSRHGDCNVPSNYPENPQLSMWVKSQRRHYKLCRSGQASSILSTERMEALEDLGFSWELRSSSEKKKK
ncbi:MAG: hypothetical protein SGBAC_000977 [Bacillariaceae sp.]